MSGGLATAIYLLHWGQAPQDRVASRLLVEDPRVLLPNRPKSRGALPHHYTFRNIDQSFSIQVEVMSCVQHCLADSLELDFFVFFGYSRRKYVRLCLSTSVEAGTYLLIAINFGLSETDLGNSIRAFPCRVSQKLGRR